MPGIIPGAWQDIWFLWLIPLFGLSGSSNETNKTNPETRKTFFTAPTCGFVAETHRFKNQFSPSLVRIG